jgi:hypothetical protein
LDHVAQSDEASFVSENRDAASAFALVSIKHRC